MKITINLNKAKEIKKEHLRHERKPLFEQLDKEFMLALEQGDEQKKQEIVQKKQQLRDITKHEDIINAESVEDISGLKITDLIE